MLRGRLILLATAIVLAAAPALRAAESSTATDADRSYLELRKSKDRGSQLLGERWASVTGLQEWTDITGEHKTTAKYVDHDPGLQWVKLRVIQGTGEKRVVKDVQVPLEKLSKTSQARVKQIATLKEKVASAIAADKEKDKEGKEPGARGDAPAAMPEQGGERMTAEGAPRGELRGSSEVAPTEEAPPSEGPASTMPSPDGPPALRLPSEINATPSASVEATPANSTPVPEGWDPNRASMPDNDPWRTDYGVLTKAFERDETDGFIRTLDDSPAITNLQLFTPDNEDRSDTATVEFTANPRLAEIGEFMWEATVAKEPSADADWNEVFALPPMLKPLRIELRLDQERGPGNWQHLKVGDHVRFIGRFIGYKGTFVWVAAIRFPQSESDARPVAPPTRNAPQSENGEPWRTSYEAFHSKVSMGTSRLGITRVNWGPIPALQAAYDQLMRFESTGSVSGEQSLAVAKMLDDIGDFTWETTLTDKPIVENDWTERIGLPPLPEPISVGFILDDKRDPGPWQNLKPGDHVRFIGRFYFFDDEASLTVMIRFPPDQSSPNGPPPTEERR